MQDNLLQHKYVLILLLNYHQYYQLIKLIQILINNPISIIILTSQILFLIIKILLQIIMMKTLKTNLSIIPF